MEVIRTGDMSHDLELNTRRFNQVLEKIIREQPETWLWGHKRWKYQPAGNPPNLYSLSSKELSDFLERCNKTAKMGAIERENQLINNRTL